MAKKILLAEDSLTIQKVFELAFAQSDFTLTTVDNGNDAVRLAGEYGPDLVVADVTLPGKDGFEVATELRQAETTRELPVLILSGTLSPFDEEKFRKSGANGVLFKPFESRELIEKTQELLKRREAAAPAAREEAAPAADEPWDFSDVLEEVEDEAGRAAGAAVTPSGEDLLPGASVAPAMKEGRVALGEFDVSLDDLAGPSAAPEEPAAPEEAAAPVEHAEEPGFTDAPVAVTDLTPAIEDVEELEEIDELEEMELLQAEAGEPKAGAAPPPAPEDTPPERPVAAPEEAPSAPAVSAAPAPSGGNREQFSARAGEIFEKVAAEAVEKVLWECMDRFSAELSAKIRESVDAVAWEVIPATAEALIREEIARIRAEAEKKSP